MGEVEKSVGGLSPKDAISGKFDALQDLSRRYDAKDVEVHFDRDDEYGNPITTVIFHYSDGWGEDELEELFLRNCPREEWVAHAPTHSGRVEMAYGVDNALISQRNDGRWDVELHYYGDFDADV